MKKVTSFFCILLAAIFLIAGCKNGLTKAEVDKLIQEALQNQQPGSPQNPGAKPTFSEILEANLQLVLGKKWTSNRSTNQAGDMGGYAKAGFDHEITFDKENFIFAVNMKDQGIRGTAETVNEDYMGYVKTGVAERIGDRLVFKNRMYIKRIYLPKLQKWLSLGGKEWNGTKLPDNDDDPTTPIPDPSLPGTPEGADTDDPFNEYFKEGMHEGYPNLVLDVELEVRGTGSGRFRNVDNLATLDKLRLVIKDGKLTLINTKEDTEPNGLTLDYSYLERLFLNYYGDISTEFGCSEWPEFKKDTGTYNADLTAFRAAFDALKTGILEDANKRKQPNAPTKWGYAQNTFTKAGDIDLVFDSDNIVAVKPALIDNPAFDPAKPEDPVTNPKQIYGLANLPPLYTTAFPEPANKDKAHPDWVIGDTLNLHVLAHAVGGKNPWEVKGFDQTATVSWDILYGDGSDSLPAKLTLTRVVKDISVEETDDPEIKSKVYPSKAYKDGLDPKPQDEEFDSGDHTNYVLANHKGQLKKFKVSYTVNLKFEDIADEALRYLWDTKTIVGKEFELVYEAVDSTHTADNNFDWVYSLDPFEVMEKIEPENKWLEFGAIVVYGKISSIKTNGNIELGTDEVELKLKTLMTGDNVLNKQTHFFLPTTLEGNKFISKITKVKIIPSHENVNFKLDASGFRFEGGSASVNWNALINEDDATLINVGISSGVKEFKIHADDLKNEGGAMDLMENKSLTVSLKGLDPNSDPKRKGKNRGPSNKKENWQGYSFVLHIGR